MGAAVDTGDTSEGLPHLANRIAGMMRDARTSPSTSRRRSWHQGAVTLITSSFEVPIAVLRASTISRRFTQPVHRAGSSPCEYRLTMARFLHSADWQLGMTRHFLEDEAQARFTAARIEVIGAIGALAAEQGCSFVVVGGDVFESSQVERQVVVRALDTMKATLGVTFYLLPGNHDPLDAASVFRSRTFLDNCPPNVVILEDAVPCLSHQASRSSVLRGPTSGR